MSITTKLRDRVDILSTVGTGGLLHADVPAHVYIVDSARAGELGAVFVSETLRVILPADIEIDRTTMVVRWRGNLYGSGTDPMYRRRNGTDHHQTVTLKRYEGGG